MESYSFFKFVLNLQLANEIRSENEYSLSKSKSSETIKCQLMTSYKFDPNNIHNASNIINIPFVYHRFKVDRTIIQTILFQIA